MTLMLLAVIACAGRREARHGLKAEGQYVLGELPGWERLKDAGGADYAWRNPQGAVIFADSNCGPNYEDSKLEDLTEKQLAGISEGEPLLSTPLSLAERSALQEQYLGRLDGVPVALGITVVKKHFCVYDFVLIAPRGASFDAAWPAYASAVEGFDPE
ncbi:MAG: hypothetical protein VX899_11740 [Myxococcota bacterium]|nr:hypothetical protein [Myxococcota bacterium]